MKAITISTTGMTSGVLETLFDSSTRVKIIRLFLLNPESFFEAKEVARRVKSPLPSVRKEVSLLKKAGLINEKTERIEEIIKLKKGKAKTKKKKIKALRLNLLFPFLNPLRNIFIDINPVDKEKIAKKLGKAGKMKLIIFSGVFIQDEESRVDLLIVGDALRRPFLERVLRNIEASVGKELTYAIFSTNEFVYRLGMYDRFIRDVLDYPHEKVVNKLNI